MTWVFLFFSFFFFLRFRDGKVTERALLAPSLRLPLSPNKNSKKSVGLFCSDYNTPPFFFSSFRRIDFEKHTFVERPPLLFFFFSFSEGVGIRGQTLLLSPSNYGPFGGGLRLFGRHSPVFSLSFRRTSKDSAVGVRWSHFAFFFSPSRLGEVGKVQF